MFASMADNTARAGGLSSMIKTRRPQRSDWRRRRRGATVALPSRAVKPNVLPLSGALVTSTSPPISSASPSGPTPYPFADAR